MSWRFRWWTDWQEVFAGGGSEAWSEALAADPDPHAFKLPELARAWVETRGREVGAAARVGLAEHRSGARVVLPWMVVTHHGRRLARRVLEPIGQSLFGYHDPVGDFSRLADADRAALWEGARKAVGACDQALFRLVAAGRAAGPLATPNDEESPVLPLAGAASLAELLARASANHRGDVRRRLRRLAERGDLDLWVAGKGDAAAALASFRTDFTPAYQAVWREQPAGSLLDHLGLPGFLERLLAEGIPGGWAHYCALTVDGEPVAWHLGLAAPGELFWWFPTYAPAWGDLSPGKVLLAKLLERLVEKGWRRVHFLTGGQPYKLAWKPEPYPLATVRWHAPTIRGRLLELYDRGASSP